jgi:type IV pilus assembly protein PilZ
MSDPSENKRSSSRAPIELKVAYERVNAFIADYTRNISRGGTFIKTQRPLPPGTEFVFTLTVPGIGDPLSIKGCVRWIVTEDEAGSDNERPDPGMGIQYRYDTDGERQEVQRRVGALIKAQLGEAVYANLFARSTEE